MTRRPHPKLGLTVQRLESLYGQTPYWPRFGDPLDELICCILSQHTADAKSFPAFHRLKRRFPDWNLAMMVSPEVIAAEIKDAGLANQKSKWIHAAVLAAARDFGEASLRALHAHPDPLVWLRALPGVGPKTAAIVGCFSLGLDVLPVDTHVFRVSKRLGFLNEGIDENKAHEVLLAKLPRGLAFRYHVTLLQHGRLVCRAPQPDCSRCPLTEFCSFFARSQVARTKERRTSGNGKGGKKSPARPNISKERGTSGSISNPTDALSSTE